MIVNKKNEKRIFANKLFWIKNIAIKIKTRIMLKINWKYNDFSSEIYENIFKLKNY